MSQVNKEFQIELPLRCLFESPTVGGLAARIEEEHKRKLVQNRGLSKWKYLVQLRSGDLRKPVFFFPGGVGGDYELLVYARFVHYVGLDYSFYGLRAESADGQRPCQFTVEEMAQTYLKEIRALQPQGPYRLIGNCTGGVVAYEVAQQLYAQNEEIAFLILMDTDRPTTIRYWRFWFDEFLQYILLRGKAIADRKFVAYYRERIRYHCEQLFRLNWREGIPNLSLPARALLKIPSDLWSENSDERGALNFGAAWKIRKIQQGYVETLRRYRPRPFRGQIIMLVNAESYQKDPSLGWAKLATGGIETYRAVGDHETYIREHVKSVATQLRNRLESAAKQEL